MPWKGETDPYKIWLSEVILQQTRVEQGWAYYERFLQHYPTVQQLAAAPEGHVFKLWEGLGYYNRCRNLLVTAKRITHEFNGVFPANYESLLTLKGVGPYTAAAIASFAFNLPHAVVDGNVFRVLARVFGQDTPIDSTPGKTLFTQLAQQHLHKQQPGAYNQAIMDFGATVCKPALPLCGHCPLQKICVAYNHAWVNKLPVKEKTLQKKKRWLYYFKFQHGNKVLIQQRTGKDIWQSLFEFYLFEADEAILWDQNTIQTWLFEQFDIQKASIKNISNTLSQQLTHQLLKGQMITVQLPKIPAQLASLQWVPQADLHNYAFPKFINSFLQMNTLNLL